MTTTLEQEKENILNLMKLISKMPNREERKRKLKPLKAILELINIAITATNFQELKMEINFGLDNKNQKTLILTDDSKGIRLIYTINKNTHKIYKYAKNIAKNKTKIQTQESEQAIA